MHLHLIHPAHVFPMYLDYYILAINLANRVQKLDFKNCKAALMVILTVYTVTIVGTK